MSIQIEVVTKIERLRELETEWSDRVVEAVGATPFQLPTWSVTWWRYFGSGELQTLIAWQDGHIKGVLPCFRHLWNDARQLTLIGSGITDYLDPYLSEDCSPAVVQAFAEYLLEGEYDLCDWQDLSAASPLLDLASVSALNVSVSPDTICSEVALEHHFESYWQNLSSDMRRNVRRYTEKAEKEGTLKFQIESEADPTVLNALFSLHTKRWQKRGESGMVGANQSAEFMREVSSLFAARNALRLFVLRWNNRVVAAILALSWQLKLYGYFSAFDPDCERLGFGRILLSRCIRYAHETGHSHWNFLRGDEAYKQSWGAVTIPKCRLTIRPRSAGDKR